MNAVAKLLLRREAGILVMIVLICTVVGAFRPRFETVTPVSASKRAAVSSSRRKGLEVLCVRPTRSRV